MNGDVARKSAPVITGLVHDRLLDESGGYSEVHLYEAVNPRRKVAVKILRTTGLAATARQQFAAEANAMAELQHPFIVGVLSTGTTEDGRPYIVMVYYPGQNLGVRATSRPFSTAEVLAVGVQVASAVHAAHRAGILHCDIKPANILVDGFGRPGLSDFGISSRMTGDPEDPDGGVSVPWAPPEVLYGTAPASVQSDLYSLGATLWHLLAGHSPFDRGGVDDQLALVHRIRETPAPRTGRPDVPDSLERLLLQCLAKEPAGRPVSAAALAHRLQTIETELGLPKTDFVVERGEGAVTRLTATAERPHRAAPTRIRPAAQHAARWVPAAASQPAPTGGPNADVAELPNRGAARRLDGSAESARVEQPGRGASPPETVRRTAAATVVAAPPTTSFLRRRGLVAAVGAVALVVGGGLGFTLLRHAENETSVPRSSRTAGAPAQNPVGPGSAAVDQGPPGRATVVATPESHSVRFGWTYPDPLPGDAFRWRAVGGTGAGAVELSTLTVAAPTGRRVCVEVVVYRADGSHAPTAADWSPAVCGVAK